MFLTAKLFLSEFWFVCLWVLDEFLCGQIVCQNQASNISKEKSFFEKIYEFEYS